MEYSVYNNTIVLLYYSIIILSLYIYSYVSFVYNIFVILIECIYL